MYAILAAGASQGAFVVIPEIPRSDISCITKNKRAVAQLMESTDQSDSPFIVAKAPIKTTSELVVFSDPRRVSSC